MNILADIIERTLIRIAMIQHAEDPEEIAHIIILRFLSNNIKIKNYAKAYLNSAVRYEIRTQKRNAQYRDIKARAYISVSGLVVDQTTHINARCDLIDLITKYPVSFGRLVRYSQANTNNKGMSSVAAQRLRKRLKASML